MLLFSIAVSAAAAGGLDPSLKTFVRTAVPEGKIVFSGAVQTADATYQLFLLVRDERTGVVLVATGSVDQPAKPPEVLFADTSLDQALALNLVKPDVAEQLNSLLGIARSAANEAQGVAAGQDVYPIGAALNTVLAPLAGFTFRSNSTLGILRELEQSDAIPVTPNAAPAGSVLVCPTRYSPSGPVTLGSVVVLGSDGKIYGLDVRKGGAWTSFGPLATWIEKNGAKNQVFGFLLRAHSDRP